MAGLVMTVKVHQVYLYFKYMLTVSAYAMYIIIEFIMGEKEQVVSIPDTIIWF